VHVIALWSVSGARATDDRDGARLLERSDHHPACASTVAHTRAGMAGTLAAGKYHVAPQRSRRRLSGRFPRCSHGGGNKRMWTSRQRVQRTSSQRNRARTQARAHTSLRTHARTHTPSHSLARSHARTCIYKPCTCTRIHTKEHTHTRTRERTQTHAHTHTHVCASWQFTRRVDAAF
jgi:hypothetical protein